MLDFNQLAQQMQGISQHLVTESTALRQKLDYAKTLMEQAHNNQGELVERQAQWHDRLTFTAAVPIEPLATRQDIAIAPSAHTVIATDGSQISPSHHEIAYCYLINIGRIILYYGQGKQPLLDSLPEVFYRPEDLYVSRQWGIRTEEWMGYCRTVSETQVLAELAQAIVGHPQASGTTTRSQSPHQSNTNPARNPRDITAQHNHSNDQLSLLDSLELSIADPVNQAFNSPERSLLELPSSPNASGRSQSSLQSSSPSRTIAPTIALVDGSLIYWFLEPLPMEARDRILQPILQAWQQLRSLKVPLVGYVSASRSGEAINFLRLQTCPYTAPDCLTHCSHLSDKLPCQVLDPVRDVALWAQFLEPGQRSPLWRSSARIQELYEDQGIYFCYLHVGSEVARVEVPEWVAIEPELLNTALSLVLTQVQKGYGYPVALAEAHNQAVVRGGDRSRFFALLEQQMIKAGLRNVGTSYKEARKRGSIA
ncbi:DNA double-strand break repair nuclease NurA [Alkalinema pantanalense CENA528]|uniref:DNA double-strand break repair nuclease NurA n=1 Tax=Alkalinema pantanalense TaxID=1620705 RepID=UPI003D6FEBE7